METNQQFFVANCNPEAIESSVKTNVENQTTSKFNVNNYLDVKLGKDETSRTVKIRLLPIDMTSGKFYTSAMTHSIKVPYQVSKSGFKTYVCLNDPSIPGYDPNVKCPLCTKAEELRKEASKHNEKYVTKQIDTLREHARQAKAEGNQQLLNELTEQATKLKADINPALYTTLRASYRSMKAKRTYFVRCIDRSKEDEGVKWWRFNEHSEQDGVFDKLLNLYYTRKKEYADDKVCDKYNIFDVNNGRDINVILTKKEEDAKGENGTTKKVVKTKVNLTDASRETPLTTNVELGNKWLTDEKKWHDCYAIKTADYLAIIADGLIPYFDKTNNKWIAKTEADFTSAGLTANMTQQTTEAVQSVANTPQPAATPAPVAPQQATVTPQQTDLPF